MGGGGGEVAAEIAGLGWEEAGGGAWGTGAEEGGLVEGERFADLSAAGEAIAGAVGEVGAGGFVELVVGGEEGWAAAAGGEAGDGEGGRLGVVADDGEAGGADPVVAG